MNEHIELAAAKRDLDAVIDRLTRLKPVVLERDGQPVAALVTMGELERWQRNDREGEEQARAFMDLAAANANLTEEEAAELVAEAIREVRAADAQLTR